MIARGVDRVVINRMLPAIVFGLVAAVAFLALATAIGAVAAYIWHCQSNGYGCPGFTAPGLMVALLSGLLEMTTVTVIP